MLSLLSSWSMRRPRHHTLIFHRVVPAQDPMSPGEPTAAWFEQLIAMLSRRFELISLETAVKRAQEDVLDGRSVSITFDDGYADNFTIALPILQKYSAPATFFVATGFLDGGRMWNDSIIEACRQLPEGTYASGDERVGDVTLGDWESRRKAAQQLIGAWKHLPLDQRQSNVDRFVALSDDLPRDLMMSTTQLRKLAASPGVTIGGHTVSHPILASISDDDARSEIARGKLGLEEKLQRELTLFAYPNGKFGKDFQEQHARIVKDIGFDCAVATDWGTLTSTTDRFMIPRFTPWHQNLDRFAVDLARCHHGLL